MAMSTIRLGQRGLTEYAAFVEPETLEALRRLAEPLVGLRVLHLSAGLFGSAVAETLAALVPLQRDVGILADWQLLAGDTPRACTALYEGLGSADVRWGQKEREAWYAFANRQAAAIGSDYDVIVAHDPQTVALAWALPTTASRPKWVWHCHLDTRGAQPDVWNDLRQALQRYAAALFPSPSLVRRDVPVSFLGIARPAIDPCSPKNIPLAPETVAALLGQLGLDPSRPIIGQFAPIDARYAPIGAIGTYWLARREIPGLQVVLVDTSMASFERLRRDLDRVLEASASDPDIHLLSAQDGLSLAELNALDSGIGVALQMAVPRGFGRGLAECQWKGKPAIVGRHGQLTEQVGDGACGFVAEGAPDAAAMVVRLLGDPALASELGRRGRAQVSRHYLIPGLLGDYLRLFRAVTAGALAAV